MMRLRQGITGRADEMVTVRGNNLHPAALQAVMHRVPGVAEYLVEIDETGTLAEVRIRVEPAAGVGRPMMAFLLEAYAQDEAPAQGVVFVDGSEGASIQLASCCRPIPGDAIVGYLGRGEGLVVHTAECQTGKRLFERDSERWMAVEWAEETARTFETSIVVLVKNAKGALAQVAAAVAAAEADITHLDMGQEPAAESTELRLLISVRDRVHLAEVLRTLRHTSVVQRVWRFKPGQETRAAL